MTTPPTLRDRAIDAVGQALNARNYWLPVEGRPIAADAVLALVGPPALPDVQGRCPACRGESLMLADGGYVTCRRLDCPDPEAATRWLERRIDYSKIREIGVEKIPVVRPACPEGRHVEHPGYTCDDADSMAAAGAAFLDSAARALAAMEDLPAALRGPNWRARP